MLSPLEYKVWVGSSLPYFKVQYEVCIWSKKMKKDQNVELLYALEVVVEEESRNGQREVSGSDCGSAVT